MPRECVPRLCVAKRALTSGKVWSGMAKYAKAEANPAESMHTQTLGTAARSRTRTKSSSEVRMLLGAMSTRSFRSRTSNATSACDAVTRMFQSSAAGAVTYA